MYHRVQCSITQYLRVFSRSAGAAYASASLSRPVSFLHQYSFFFSVIFSRPWITSNGPRALSHGAVTESRGRRERQFVFGTREARTFGGRQTQSDVGLKVRDARTKPFRTGTAQNAVFSLIVWKKKKEQNRFRVRTGLRVYTTGSSSIFTRFGRDRWWSPRRARFDNRRENIVTGTYTHTYAYTAG